MVLDLEKAFCPGFQDPDFFQDLFSTLGIVPKIRVSRVLLFFVDLF